LPHETLPILQNADIVVFPEYGLSTLSMPTDRNLSKPYLLQVPEIGLNPCTTNIAASSPPIEELSCAAKNHSIYVVVNIGEIRNCNSKTMKTCPDDNVWQYNTNVVFDREGNVVAKCLKRHLYFEDQFDIAPDGQQGCKFITDFGVNFGLFISFDVNYYEPAIRLVSEGVRNFIFTAAWFDALPFVMGK